MNIFLFIILTLCFILLIISLSLFYVIKYATYLSKKEKEFISFAIDMYIDYAKELNIESPQQHEFIVKQLKKIKEEKIK
jgi:hypothetical protein